MSAPKKIALETFNLTKRFSETGGSPKMMMMKKQ